MQSSTSLVALADRTTTTGARVERQAWVGLGDQVLEVDVVCGGELPPVW